ncbi:TPA: hypothetical protein I8303_001437 [Aeromonas hydrophila]|uniref:hypothetical protein n=1 Tax=Aeromonas hydrophila TaxID=644 RepID=UPI000C327A50|nr:hypothetical protein [Aeromonas hydrophila]PKD26432.1 hypothetical protein AO056_00216 [Aeromonas hydrophila]WRK90007.1 hypothetical protein U8518_11190 [Aeromonas hydrophila]HAT2712728.1 hypothetical protein [Aeromonas hydrophila]
MNSPMNPFYERLIREKKALQEHRAKKNKQVWAAVSEYQRQALRDELDRIIRQRAEAGLKPLSKAAYEREKQAIQEKLRRPEFVRPILARANAALNGTSPRPLWMFGEGFNDN